MYHGGGRYMLKILNIKAFIIMTNEVFPGRDALLWYTSLAPSSAPSRRTLDRILVVENSSCSQQVLIYT